MLKAKWNGAFFLFFLLLLCPPGSSEIKLLYWDWILLMPPVLTGSASPCSLIKLTSISRDNSELIIIIWYFLVQNMGTCIDQECYLAFKYNYTGKLCHHGKCHSGNCHSGERWMSRPFRPQWQFKFQAHFDKWFGLPQCLKTYHLSLYIIKKDLCNVEGPIHSIVLLIVLYSYVTWRHFVGNK